MGFPLIRIRSRTCTRWGELPRDLGSSGLPLPEPGAFLSLLRLFALLHEVPESLSSYLGPPDPAEAEPQPSILEAAPVSSLASRHGGFILLYHSQLRRPTPERRGVALSLGWDHTAPEDG